MMNSFPINPIIAMPIEQPKVFFLIKVSGENSSGIITQKSAGSPIAGRKLGAMPKK